MAVTVELEHSRPFKIISDLRDSPRPGTSGSTVEGEAGHVKHVSYTVSEVQCTAQYTVSEVQCVYTVSEVQCVVHRE